MTAQHRRLPYVLTPLPDEPLDSWLESYAWSYGTSLGELAAALGLLVNQRHVDPHAVRSWSTALTTEQIDALSTTTGRPPSELASMTRLVFARHVVRVTKGGRISAACPSTGVAARYCPECISDSRGRWRMSWQFPFGFACGRHRRLLIDHCPTCLGPPRGRAPGLGLKPHPGRCQNTGPGSAAQHASVRCLADLALATPGATAGEETLATQRTMLRVVSTGAAGFGIYEDDPQPALRAFEDMALLSRAARDALGAGARPSWLPDTQLTASWEAVERPDPKRYAARPAAAIDVAVGNVVAHAALRNTERITELLAGRVSPHTPLDRFSPTLQHAITTALGRRRRPTAMLQAANSLDEPDIEARAAKLPAVLWMPWTARLAPRRTNREIAGGALAAATVFTGTRLTHAAAVQLLDPANRSRQVTHVMRALGANRPEDQTVRAIRGLARYLDDHDIPVDYARRRTLDYNGLLTHDSWIELCRLLNVNAGGIPRWRLARASLYVLLSGNRVATVPFSDGDGMPSFEAVDDFRRTAPPEIDEALRARGRDFLLKRDIDEPIEWIPDLATVGLEGRSLDLDRRSWGVSRPARARVPGLTAAQAYASGKSLASIAAQYGVAKQTVARVIDPMPVARRNGSQRIEIDPHWLRRRYLDDKRTIVELAEEVGVSRTLINRRLNEARIPTRPRGSASRADAIRTHDCAAGSELLTRVLTGQGSRLRAERFLTVVQHPTIKSAAAALHITAPTLSLQCGRLSDDAGGPLIEAGKRPLRLTQLGRQLVAELEAAFAREHPLQSVRYDARPGGPTGAGRATARRTSRQWKATSEGSD